MVESNSQNGFVKMVTQQKYMVIIAFLPFLNIQEMARFYRLNNACEELMFKINFKILFEAQGIKLRPDLIEALNTSPSLALLAGLKALKLNNNSVTTVTAPHITTLGDKTLEDLRKLAITKV